MMASVNFETANSAPRILNDPVNCNASSLSQTGTPNKSESPEENSTGVRRILPAKNSPASRISSIILATRSSRPFRTGYWLLATSADKQPSLPQSCTQPQSSKADHPAQSKYPATKP